MKSDPYWKTSKEVFYYLPYSNEQKPSHLKVICFCAEFFCFISQALALTTLLSAKLRGLGETGIKSCLNLLLGEVLKFPHSGAGFQTSNIYLYFTSFLNPFQFFHVKLFFFFLCTGIMTVSLTTYPIHPCLTKVTLERQPAGWVLISSLSLIALN